MTFQRQGVGMDSSILPPSRQGEGLIILHAGPPRQVTTHVLVTIGGSCDGNTRCRGQERNFHHPPARPSYAEVSFCPTIPTRSESVVIVI